MFSHPSHLHTCTFSSWVAREARSPFCVMTGEEWGWLFPQSSVGKCLLLLPKTWVCCLIRNEWTVLTPSIMEVDHAAVTLQSWSHLVDTRLRPITRLSQAETPWPKSRSQFFVLKAYCHLSFPFSLPYIPQACTHISYVNPCPVCEPQTMIPHVYTVPSWRILM